MSNRYRSIESFVSTCSEAKTEADSASDFNTIPFLSASSGRHVMQFELSKTQFSIERPDRIGYDRTHDQSIEIAEQVCRLLFQNEGPRSPHSRSPIVCLQPQQGKTSCMATCSYILMHANKILGRTAQFIYISAMAETYLRDQTLGRLTETTTEDGKGRSGAQLDILARHTGSGHFKGNEGILVLNRTERLLKLVNELPKVDVRYWFIDEVHLGNGGDGQLNKMFQSFGVFLNRQMHQWKQKDGTINHVIGFSATPFAHTLLTNEFTTSDRALFETISVKPTGEYNSLKRMLDNGRIRQTYDLVKKGLDGQPYSTQFGREQLIDRKSKQYTIVRAVGRKYDLLRRLIGKMNVECHEFNAKEENINDLNSYLAKKPLSHVVVLIKGAMRAGITLHSRKYIRAWIETDSRGTDSVTQSGAGRACGYEGRILDTYPIYCNVEAIRDVVRYYEDLSVCPRGIQSLRRVNTKQVAWQPGPVFDTEKEARRYINEQNSKLFSPDDSSEVRRMKRACVIQRMSTYGNRDGYETFLSRKEFATNSIKAISFDGPCTSRHTNAVKNRAQYNASHVLFARLHPEFVRKIVVLSRVPELLTNQEDGLGFVKKTSALYPDQDQLYN